MEAVSDISQDRSIAARSFTNRLYIEFLPANVLVKLVNLGETALLVQPLKSEVLTGISQDRPRSTPKYLVLPADLTALGSNI